MNKGQQTHFKSLTTQQQRASYLLTIGVTAKSNIENLDFVWRAAVGEVTLPVTGESASDAVMQGTKWLEEKAAAV